MELDPETRRLLAGKPDKDRSVWDQTLYKLITATRSPEYLEQKRIGMKEVRLRQGRKPWKRVAYDGEMRTLPEVARLNGISFKNYRSRVDRGWDPMKAATQPVAKRSK